MKTATHTGRHAIITWVEKGTRNAACLGFDETIIETTDCEIDVENLIDCAIDFGANAGIDLNRFEPIVDVYGPGYLSLTPPALRSVRRAEKG